MSKHLIFRGSCEEEYYPYFVNIITNFGITPQVFSSNVPIANARRSLSMHAVLDFFVFNFDLEYIFIFAFLISKVRHHDGCGQVAASGEEGGNKSQPPSGETGRVHLQFANISLQKHLDGKPEITLGFFCRQSCWLSRSTLRTSRGSCWTRILASARSSTTPRTKTPWTGASSSFLQQQISNSLPTLYCNGMFLLFRALRHV